MTSGRGAARLVFPCWRVGLSTSPGARREKDPPSPGGGGPLLGGPGRPWGALGVGPEQCMWIILLDITSCVLSYHALLAYGLERIEYKRLVRQQQECRAGGGDIKKSDQGGPEHPGWRAGSY